MNIKSDTMTVQTNGTLVAQIVRLKYEGWPKGAPPHAQPYECHRVLRA